MTAVIPVYFDLLSPYSWLALRALDRFAEERAAAFEARPVVYAALLDAAGLVGPAESASKRAYTFRDIQRLARLARLPCQGPPAHPFRSLEALRAVVLFREDRAAALGLAVALAAACWEDGRDLTELAVLGEIIAGQGLDASDLEARLSAPETKLALRANTEEGIAAGAFGVPTFVYEGELFWGQDRLSHLAARLDGRIPAPAAGAAAILDRPRGVDRKQAPDR